MCLQGNHIVTLQQPCANLHRVAAQGTSPGSTSHELSCILLCKRPFQLTFIFSTHCVHECISDPHLLLASLLQLKYVPICRWCMSSRMQARHCSCPTPSWAHMSSTSKQLLISWQQYPTSSSAPQANGLQLQTGAMCMCLTWRLWPTMDGCQPCRYALPDLWHVSVLLCSSKLHDPVQ